MSCLRVVCDRDDYWAEAVMVVFVDFVVLLAGWLA